MEKSDSKQASIRLESIHGKSLACHEVTGKHFGFNSRYQIQVKGRSIDVLNMSDCKKSVVQIEATNLKKQTLTGHLLSIEQNVFEYEGFEFCLLMGSPLFCLDNDVCEKVYVDTSLTEILTHFLKKYSITFEIDIKKNDCKIPCLYQNGISDYNFLIHLCAQFGIVFYHQFRQGDVLVSFTDEVKYINMGEVDFNAGSGMNHQSPSISTLSKWDIDIAEHMHLAMRHERDVAEQFLNQTTNTTTSKGHGQIDLRNITPITSQDDLSLFADGLQQQLDWQRSWLYTEISCLLLWPAHFIHINNHKTLDSNEPYQAIDTSFRLNLLGEANNDGLRAQTFLIPLSRPYRMPISQTRVKWPESIQVPPPHCLMQQTEIPTIGLTRSVIYGETKTPQLDQQGQYMISSFYENDQQPIMSRLLHPGCLHSLQSASGIHFPLHPKTRVITTQCNHNMSLPVILGVVPDIEQPSVVTQKNKTHSAIKFQSGTSLVFEESHKFLKLALYIKDDSHGLIFKSQNFDSAIRVRSHQDILFQSKSGLLMRSTETMSMQSGQVTCGTQENACFMSMNTFRICGKLMNVKASNNWICISQKKTLNIKATNRMYVFSEGLVFKGHDFYVNSQKVQIQAKTNHVLKGDDGVEFAINNTSLKLGKGSILLLGSGINFLSNVIIKNQGVKVEVI